jgi:uncharacterized membrane protein
MTSNFSVGESLSFGWRVFKSRAWFFIGAMLLTTLISFAIQYGTDRFGTEVPGVIVGFLVSFVLSTLLVSGILHFFLKAHDDAGNTHYRDLWHPKPFLNYLGTSILYTLMVFIGILLFIVPGIYLSLVFFMAAYVAVDRNMSPIAALKESARLTRGSRWKLLLFTLAALGLIIIGSIPLFLGLIVVGPLLALAGTHIYRTLSEKAGALTLAPAPAPEAH